MQDSHNISREAYIDSQSTIRRMRQSLDLARAELRLLIEGSRARTATALGDEGLTLLERQANVLDANAQAYAYRIALSIVDQAFEVEQ